MEYKNEDIVKYVEGMINHERVVEFLKANINLEEDYQFKCRNVYEYIEGMMKYNEVQYRGYIDRVYFKEIEKFLKFYIIAYLMVYKAEKVNLKQTTARIYEFTDEEMGGLDYDDIYDNPKMLDGCDDFIKFYDKMTTDFSNATIEKEVFKQAGIRISKRKNYEGKKIRVHSIKEMKVLNSMWRAKLDGIDEAKEAEKAYKKIRGNKVNIMTDKNYNEIHSLLSKDIDTMDEEFKNIYYYKLERKQQYELRKVIFKNINKLDTEENKVKYIVYSVVHLTTVPVLTIRESLSNKLYNAIDKTSRYSIKQFESEVRIINELVNKSIKQALKVIGEDLATLEAIENQVSYYEKAQEVDKKLVNGIKEKMKLLGSDITSYGFFTPNDIKEFKKIYNQNEKIREFQNNYKIKKDYSAKDVELYSKTIHLINQYQLAKIVDNVKKVNSKR